MTSRIRSAARGIDVPFTLVSVLWLALTAAPHLQAALWPPAGRVFPGAFVFDDDVYQHLSFAEQAARGALLLSNKFDLRPHEPFLVNLEWTAQGALSALLGGRQILAFQLAGALAGLLALGVVDAVLRRSGLRGRDRGWGLVLFGLGSGLGWLRLLSGTPFVRVPDAFMALYPFNLRIIGGPHGLLGFALLLLALVGYARWRSNGGARSRWLAPAALLGLVRPYDLGLFLATACAVEATTAARTPAGLGAAFRRTAELAWLAPVLFHDFLAFTLHPAFSGWSGPQSATAHLSASELLWTFGLPAAILLASWRTSRTEPGWAPLRFVLVTSLATALCLASLPLSWALQFAGTSGALLLTLVAAQAPVRALPPLALALAPTSLLVLLIFLNFDTSSFPSRDTFRAVELLERECRPGDLAMSDPDRGLYVAGLTSCTVVVGHRVLTPEFERRRAEALYFMHESAPAAWRHAYARRMRVRFALSPPGGLAGQPDVVSLGRFGDVELWRIGP